MILREEKSAVLLSVCAESGPTITRQKKRIPDFNMALVLCQPYGEIPDEITEVT
jgi:hypothetical protein